MTGTIVNAAAIVLGGLLAKWSDQSVPLATQNRLKVALGALTVFFGLRLTWLSLNGAFLQILGQLGVVVLAMMLGRSLGRLVGLQRLSNRLGRAARERMEASAAGGTRPFSEGFNTCAALFCAAPLAVLGAVQEGLGASPAPLFIKAVMDGLAVLAFVKGFGWGPVFSALPVLAWQGTLTLLAALAAPWLSAHELLHSVNATGGMLVFCVALVILDIKKLELADYLASLACAPLLTWLFRLY